MKSFALIGAAGYVAPRHMNAIKETDNCLVAALDPHDSVGVIDSYFPSSSFFTEFERFDRHIDKLRRSNSDDCIDFVSICSPNYLHDAHIRFALRSGADAICEKPLVLNPWNLDGLLDFQRSMGGNVYTILQLRLHPAIVELKRRVDSSRQDSRFDVDLSYVTSRGKWYLSSWKGDVKKSGGLVTNIGVHFFDMLHYVFGDVQENKVHYSSEQKAGGYIEYEHARVRWFLSIDIDDIPGEKRLAGESTYRSIKCNGERIEFSGGFTDLHTQSYRDILNGHGFGIEENRSAVGAVATIRNAEPVGLAGDFHPFLRSQY